MTDPTIPELVARLRELHSARRYPTETLATTIRDDQSAQVYATSTGPMRAVRPVAETTVDHADLIAETLNALPAILDALDHVGEVNKMVRGIPERTQGMQRERSTVVAYLHDRARQWEDDSGIPAILQGLAADIRSGEHVEARNHGELDDILDALERHPSGDPGGVEQSDNPGVSYLRTVANNLRLRGGTITFTAGQLETVLAGLGAHSPDGGNIVDQFRAAGQRLRAQLYRWRPISEPPSAGVHAWCGGFFLFRHVDGGFTWQWERPGSKPQLFSDMARNGWKEYLPIPPSDERRG